MFAETLRSLEAFVGSATGRATRIGPPLEVTAGTGSTEPTPGDHAKARTDGGGDGAEPAITLHLVSVARTERLQNQDREVTPDPSGNGAVRVRQAPGWFDLTVAIEDDADELVAAESMERLIAATMRSGDLAAALAVDSEYPIYAAIDTPGPDELRAWWQHGLIRTPGAALRAVVTVAVQPFEHQPTGIVRTRRLHSDDMRTKVRETVER
ncbi:MAG: hypothetical protein L3K06_01205 [Thermoplasmata archaeon]|nr:hypothetical protein [Thermoplasmata archaeon]